MGKKKSDRKYAVIAAAVLLFALAMLLGACVGTGTGPVNTEAPETAVPCFHEDKVWVDTVEATCTEEGVAGHYVCTACGDCFDRDGNPAVDLRIPPTDHDYVFDSFVWSGDHTTAKARYVCRNNAEHIETYDAEVTGGVITEPTCQHTGSAEYTASYDGNVKTEQVTLSTVPHDFSIPEGNYFLLSACSVCGAHTTTRREGEHTYDDKFVIDYTSEKGEEIVRIFLEVVSEIEKNILAPGEEAPAFVKDSELYKANKAFENDYFSKFQEQYDYMVGQNLICEVLYFVNYGDRALASKFGDISLAFSNVSAEYYTLYALVYNTRFRNYFYSEEDGWTQDDIDKMVSYASVYTDEKMVEANAEMTNITNEFYEIMDPAFSDKVPELYEKYIALANAFGKAQGYSNYLEAAYDLVYGRSYTPNDAATIRTYIKKYFSEILLTLAHAAGQPDIDDPNKLVNLFDLQGSVTFFNSGIACDAIYSYLERLGSLEGAEKNLNFADELNTVFKTNKYFRGIYDTAFTGTIDPLELTIMYFSEGYYSTPTALVHEFGHYMNEIRNGSDISYDIAEIQSQGNESLFIYFLNKYIADNLSTNSEIPRMITLNMLLDSFSTILLTAAVDEFEYLCYTGTYDGTDPAIISILSDGKVDASEFDSLFKQVLTDYGIAGLGFEDYWRGVTLSSPGYYISYAVSLIPSVCLFDKAVEEGLDAAIESYKRFFTFTDEDRNLSFEEVVSYAGLDSPFDESLYIRLRDLANDFAAGKTIFEN